VLAVSGACLCAETDGAPSVLYFPSEDIDFSACRDEGASASADGKVQHWSVEGEQVLTVVTDPSDARAPLRGSGTFDPALVTVEVLDGPPGASEDQITIKRFPPWGDAGHLAAMLDVRQDGDLHFVSVAHTDGQRPVVEASQMLGQAIVAASRHAPGRRAVSASMIFVRAADAFHPLEFVLSELSAGRTFSGLTVEVRQGGRTCAAGTILLDITAPQLLSHAIEPPAVPGPWACPHYDMGVTGRELRIVDDAYTNDSDAPVGPPLVDCWVRFRDLPDDPPLHVGLMAQFAGHMPIAAALRSHAGIGQDQAHRTLSMGINAIHLSVHRDLRADEWMLYHHHSTFAGDGMTHAECRVHAEDGALLASFTVDAMVRAFPDGVDGAERDERTAL
jgi:acyl-CoA thioesterase-2